MVIDRVELWSQAIFQRRRLEEEFKNSINPLRKIELWLEILSLSVKIEDLTPRGWASDGTKIKSQKYLA